MLPGLHYKDPRRTHRQDCTIFPHKCPVPKTYSSDSDVQATRDLTHALLHPAPIVENQLLYIVYIMKLYHDLKFNRTYIFSHFHIRVGNR